MNTDSGRRLADCEKDCESRVWHSSSSCLFLVLVFVKPHSQTKKKKKTTTLDCLQL